MTVTVIANPHTRCFVIFFVLVVRVLGCVARNSTENVEKSVFNLTGTVICDPTHESLGEFKRFCRVPQIAITVSSLTNKYLEVSWDIDKIIDGDWIGLFDTDPKCQITTQPLYTNKVENTQGWFTSNVTDVQKPSESLGFESTCLGFWAAYVNENGTVLVSSCMKTNPTWMYDMRHYLKNIQLKKAFIPGTHDSGSFLEDNAIPMLNIVEKYVFTQDEDILGQLIHGVRYLDLRVSSYTRSLNERWWVNHGVYKIRPLKEVLNDVKIFLENTNEIVILDLHGFPVGFKYENGTHEELVNYLKSELIELMAPPNWSCTFNDLWKMNKRLVVSYNDAGTVSKFDDLLWPRILHKWANAQSMDVLQNYLQIAVESRPSYSWAAMAELTPSAWSILMYSNRGLREMADNVNQHVGRWFRGIWGRTCNIVAVDFVKSTDIVQTAIKWNWRRARRSSCDYELS